MVKFWDGHMHKIKPWYAKVQREDDIIVSGTTDFLLDEVMHRLGSSTMWAPLLIKTPASSFACVFGQQGENLSCVVPECAY